MTPALARARNRTLFPKGDSMSELAEEAGRIIANESEYREPPPREGKKRGRPRKVKEPDPVFTYVPNESSIKACVMLSSVVMRIVCRLSKWENLTEEEELELGHALDPVIQKRLPILTGWGEEIGLGMVLVGIIAPRAMESKIVVPSDDDFRVLKEEEPPIIITPEPEKSDGKKDEKVEW